MPKGRLLILDDDPLLGRTIAFIGEDSGLETRSTTDPRAFFRELDLWHPTYVAIDLVMPQMDGVEVMQHLARLHCRARIIITSGMGGRVLDAARRSAAEHGLDVAGVLSKPFSSATLRELIGENQNATLTPTPLPRSAPPCFEVNETELRRALERRELQLAYQPKVDCATGEVRGFEALVRWYHPEAGLIMPDCFIPLAETSGLIGELTEHVFDLGLQWLSRYFPESPLRLSVNISAKNLGDLRLVDRVCFLAHHQRIDPSRLIFEITETSAMDDPVTSLGMLTRFRVKGFHLSIDDFGTGFSSMVQLVRLPFTEIKVDKSFVMVAMQSQESRTIIKSIVDLSHSLGLQVTAEGVEDRQTLDFLIGVGCDLAQGYFIARPMAGDAVVNWIAAWETTAKNAVSTPRFMAVPSAAPPARLAA